MTSVIAGPNRLAKWSSWSPWNEAVRIAPPMPGVYMIQVADRIVYVGHAGERAGGIPGIRGRLAIYKSGKGAASGFGMAALDRALVDPDFVRARLSELEEGRRLRTVEWAKAAIASFGPTVCWTTTPDKASAADLERRVEDALRLAAVALWNR